MNTDLYLVPIEPLAERYTGEWYLNFPPAFREAGFTVTTIDGQVLEDTVKVGTFLDVNSTVHYKMSQLQAISKLFHEQKVRPGSVFFFSDVEFWGLESVRLLSQMNGVPIKMCGFLHAASYTLEDAFAVAAPYQQFTELGWLAALDEVYVGSRYHRNAFINRRIFPHRSDLLPMAQRIISTGNPLFPQAYEQYPGTPKQRKMVLTNRFDREKRPDQTVDLFCRLKRLYPEWEFVVTTSRQTFRSNFHTLVDRARWAEGEGLIKIKAGLTKEQYHQELAEASVMVSHSIEENYGYCIAEALIYKTIPLLRKGLSHDEFLPKNPELLFDLEEDPGSDFHKAQVLMAKFGTPYWPEVPTLHTDGLVRIVESVSALVNSN